MPLPTTELLEPLRAEARRQLEEITRAAQEASQARQQFQQEREQTLREFSEFRAALAAAQQELTTARAKLKQGRTEQTTIDRQTEELKGQLTQVHQSLVHLLQQVDGVRTEVMEARRLLQVLPREAEELQRRLAKVRSQQPEAERQLQEVTAAAGAAKQELEEVEVVSREAQQRLEVVREETDQAERRVAAARQEFEEAEAALRAVRTELEQVTEEVRETREEVQERRDEVAEVASATLASINPNRLGVTVEAGVVIADVLPDSPASRAALQRGDVIATFNGTPVFSGPELRCLVQRLVDETEVSLQVLRGHVPQECQLRLAPASATEKPTEDQNQRLGLTVEPGVVVAEVQPASPAEVAGLARGEVIVSVNGTSILTGEQLRQAVLTLPPRAEVNLQLSSRGEMREVRALLDEGTGER